MIDWKEAFPNPTQFYEIDCEDEVNNDCKPQINFFNSRKEKATTLTELKALIESQVERLEANYKNIEPRRVVRSLDGINLYPLYKFGWDSAINMMFETPNNCYKHMPEIKEQVLAMYNETGTPPGYFETLSKISIEEVISGMTDAKYYLFLKEQLRLTEQTTASKPSEKEKSRPVKPVKTFEQYFAPKYKETLPQALKEAFIGKKGKDIRLMIEALKDKGIFCFIGTDEELFRVIELYFGGEKSIGSRVGIFQSYQYNPEKAKCKKEFNDTSLFIENIIKELQ